MLRPGNTPAKAPRAGKVLRLGFSSAIAVYVQASASDTLCVKLLPWALGCSSAAGSWRAVICKFSKISKLGAEPWGQGREELEWSWTRVWEEGALLFFLPPFASLRSRDGPWGAPVFCFQIVVGRAVGRALT